MSTQKYGCLSETYSNYSKCFCMGREAKNILLYFLISLNSVFILLMFQAKKYVAENNATIRDFNKEGRVTLFHI